MPPGITRCARSKSDAERDVCVRMLISIRRWGWQQGGAGALPHGLLEGGADLLRFDLELLAGLGIAGFIVGFGVHLGSGCTSGHGVCCLGRLSLRSLIATLLFMASGVVTVFVLRQVAGVAS